MQSESDIQLHDVQAVYSGPEFALWELLMGQQVHIGGLQSSKQLAEKAAIREGTMGIDLCCCTGAGMCFLVRFCNVQRMLGVDATESVVTLGRQRCRFESFRNGRLHRGNVAGRGHAVGTPGLHERRPYE